MGGERALLSVERRAVQATVVACGLTSHQRSYVADGLRRAAECQFIDSFDELDRVLPSVTRCDVLVLVPQDPRGRSALAVVERVAREWPATAIVVFCPPRPEPSPSIRSLALAGAHQFVFEGVSDTASTLALAVENARRACAADAVFKRLQPHVPVALHSMAHAVLGRPDTLTSVEEVAVAVGVHRKTLVNRCARSDYLQPGELIAWCRLAMVGHMLEKTGSTVEAIALTLGFPSHTSLRNLIKRYTGCTATDIRNGAGLGAVLEALASRLAAWRGAAMSQR